jgi:hypothetical protein
MKQELEIISILKQAKRPLHWKEIYNECLGIPGSEEYKPNPKSFAVKLSRILKRMVKDKVLILVSSKHRNVTYDLNPNYNESFYMVKEQKLERLTSLLDALLDSVFTGTWEPGISFEDLRKRAHDQWEEYFQKSLEPQLRGFWHAMNQVEE